MGALGDQLAGNGGTYLKWETPGTTYKGTITDVQVRQARKYESTELDTWDDGTPKMQAVITLATEYRDASIDDDDGTRLISINLWSGQKKSLMAACKAADVGEPEPGMTFTATHVSGVGNAKSPRIFEYVIGKTSGVAAALGSDEPASAPAAATAAGNPAEIAKGLLASGLSVDDVASATGLPATTVAAIAALVTTAA